MSVLRTLPRRRGLVSGAVSVAVLAVVLVRGLVAGGDEGTRIVITDAPSFRAVLTVSGTVDGEAVLEQHEIAYSAPDGFSALPVGEWVRPPKQSRILIGDRGWARFDPSGEWKWMSPPQVDAARLLTLEPLGKLQRFLDADFAETAGAEDVLGLMLGLRGLLVFPTAEVLTSDGPQAAGEQTVRYTRSDPDYGHTMAEMYRSFISGDSYFAIDDETVAELVEEYRDVVAEYELLVGAETRRLHRFTATQRGPNLDLTFEITFSGYGEPVSIEPPETLK